MPFVSTVGGSFFAGRRSSGISGSWSPATDITPAIWLDASDTSSYTGSGGEVTAITDKAGNATVTVNGSPNTATTLNSYPTFTFQSGFNEDFTTTAVNQTTAGGDHWAIGVFQWNSVDNTRDSFWSVENTSELAGSKRDYSVSAGNSSAFDGELDLDGLSTNRISTTIGDKQDFDSGIAQNTWTIIGVFFNKSGNQIGVRVDGANAFTPVNDYDFNVNQSLDLRIMRNRASVRMDGKMAEFFSVAGAPGTGLINMDHFISAEGYLAHKWGLAGTNLPADHPHKSSAP